MLNPPFAMKEEKKSSCVICHISHVMRHVSGVCVKCRMSPVNSHLSLTPTATATEYTPANHLIMHSRLVQKDPLQKKNRY